MIDEKKLIEELKSEYMHFSLLDMNKMGHETACHRSGINCGILTAIRRVEQQPKVGEWIPCSERLPEEYGNYLVTSDEDVDIGTFNPDTVKWSCCDADSFYWTHDIIAWMPLPPAFKGE